MIVENNSFRVIFITDNFQFPYKSRLKLPLNTHDNHFLQIFIVMGLMKASAEVKWFEEGDELGIIFSHRRKPNNLLKGR